MNFIKNLYKEKPFHFIIFVGVFLRLLAAIFSQGYLMHDDHFLMIETGGSWADGKDALGWLPGTELSWGEPQGHSLLFPGMNMYIIQFVKSIGVSDPKIIMVFVRLFTSSFSILALVYGIKLVRKLANQKTSILVGWVLAILWFLPFLGARSLVELACIPFLIIPIYQIIKYEKKELGIWIVLIAGLLLGLAFSIRFQTALFTLGIGIYLVFKQKWLEAFLITLGFAIVIILTQGLIDYFIWGKPFAEMQAYIDYNATHSEDYALTQWWAYILMLLFMSLSISNVGWVFGFFKVFKKYLLITLPVMIFLAFHTYFPNRQERFIIPVIPLFIMIGIIGWNEFLSQKNNQSLKKINRFGIWMFFILNIPLGMFLNFSYSKKSRVEAAYYLSKKDHDKYTILIENTAGGSVPQYPKFYSQNWDTQEFYIGNPDDFKKLKWFQTTPKGQAIQYIFFFNNKNIEVRVDSIKNYLPNIVEETKIESGYIDKILHKMNPRNNNHDVYIFRNLDYDS